MQILAIKSRLNDCSSKLTHSIYNNSNMQAVKLKQK
jgi:hypothetical protein